MLHASDSYGGAVWALAARPAVAAPPSGSGGGGGGGGGGGAGGEEAAGGGGAELVAACDDGSLRTFRVTPDAAGLEYVGSLCKVEGKSLAAAWHPEGRVIVSGGSDGCIHAWDFATGACVCFFAFPRSHTRLLTTNGFFFLFLLSVAHSRPPINRPNTRPTPPTTAPHGTGREMMRITAAVASTTPPRIWSLAVLPDGTIVAGSSDGATQFFEGRFGTLISRLQQHAADVMAVAASADGRLVFSAGVDPRVAVFARVEDSASGTERWAYLAHKAPHTHDVRALTVTPRGGGDELLLSGGADGQLVAYPAQRLLEEHPVRLTKAPQAPLLQLAPAARGGAARLLLAQGRRLSLWRIGRAASRPAGVDALAGSSAAEEVDAVAHEGDPLDVIEPPACLAELKLRGPRHLTCAAISADGSRLAASDAGGLRLFAVEGSGGGTVSVQRVGGTPEEGAASAGQRTAPLPPAVALAFAANGRSVYSVDASGCIRCIDTATARVQSSLQLDPSGARAAGDDAWATDGQGDGSGSDSGGDSDSDSDAEDGERRRRRLRLAGSGGSVECPTAADAAQPAVSSLAVSPDGSWLAAAAGANVELVSLGADGAMSHAGPLLLLSDADAGAGVAPVTSLAFSSDSSLLAVATASDVLAAYSVATRAPTLWSSEHAEPLGRLLGLLPGVVERLSFCPGAGAPSMLVQSAGGLCHVDLDAPVSADVLSSKRRRGPVRQRPGAAAAAAGLNGRVLPLDSPCLFLGYLSPSAALLVERPWEEVIASLPPPLYRHRYGS